MYAFSEDKESDMSIMEKQKQKQTFDLLLGAYSIHSVFLAPSKALTVTPTSEYFVDWDFSVQWCSR